MSRTALKRNINEFCEQISLINIVYNKKIRAPVELEKVCKKIYSRYLIEITDSIKLAESLLIQQSSLTKFSEILKSKLITTKKSGFLSLKSAEKYYKFPYSKKYLLHNLSSTNSQSTSTAFSSLLSIKKNTTLDESQC